MKAFKQVVHISPNANKSISTKGRALVERVRGSATVRMRTDEILSITRGARDEKDTRRQ